MKVHVLILALLVLLSGCVNLGVSPWQREVLSREMMIPGQAEAVDDAYDDHIYFSKEGASGGRGFGGGGCGCN